MWEHVRKNAGWCVTGLILVLLVIAGVLVWCFWDWLRVGADGYESGTATVRNLGLLVTAIIALPLGIWRSFVAHRQSQAAQQGLLNERYQKGAEMLGSEVLWVRLGGIYTLSRLAEEHSHQYHIQVMHLFCIFVREAIRRKYSEVYDRSKGSRKPMEDILAIMGAMGYRSDACIALEKKNGFRLDLSVNSRSDENRLYIFYAQLPGSDFSNTILGRATFEDADFSNAKCERANFKGATFEFTVLSGVNFENANLAYSSFSDVILTGSNLSGANLVGAKFEYPTDLTGTNFMNANLSGAEFTKECTGLTQEQLDQACAYIGRPPKLDGLLDSKTGIPLVWHGKPLDDE